LALVRNDFWKIEMKKRFVVLMICISIALNACAKKIESQEEAIELSKKEITRVLLRDNVDFDSLSLVNTTWNYKLALWTVLYENKARTYRLNVLVKNADSIEIHTLDERQ